MQFQRLASAFFISGCALATVSWFAAIAGEVAVVTAKSLNVRTGPGNEYRSTYVLRQGDRVEIIERKGEWSKIVGERGGEGWVYARYLDVQNSGSNNSSVGKVAVVTAKSFNVRTGPGNEYRSTYVLRQGDRVEIIEQQDEWSKIVGESGGEGWVQAAYLSEQDSGSNSGGDFSNETNYVYRSNGKIENARYSGPGSATVVMAKRGNNFSLGLVNPAKFSVEYIGTLRSNFEGNIQGQINNFQSSALGYRTLPASGDCNIQVSGGTIRSASCLVNGTNIDHGKSTFTAQ